MKRTELRQKLYTYLNNNWTKTAIAWEEMDYEPDGTNPYIRPFILMGDSVVGEIGQTPEAIDWESGILYIHVFTSVQNSGITKGEILAEDIRTLFRRKNINGVHTGKVDITSNKIDPDDKRYYMHVCKVEIKGNIVNTI